MTSLKTGETEPYWPLRPDLFVLCPNTCLGDSWGLTTSVLLCFKDSGTGLA